MKLRQTYLHVSRRANGAFCRYRRLLYLVGNSCGHAGVISGDNIEHEHEHEREGEARRVKEWQSRRRKSRTKAGCPSTVGRGTPRHQQTTSIAFRHTNTHTHTHTHTMSSSYEPWLLHEGARLKDLATPKLPPLRRLCWHPRHSRRPPALRFGALTRYMHVLSISSHNKGHSTGSV
jgi:hypothetical protein